MWGQLYWTRTPTVQIQCTWVISLPSLLVRAHACVCTCVCLSVCVRVRTVHAFDSLIVFHTLVLQLLWPSQRCTELSAGTQVFVKCRMFMKNDNVPLLLPIVVLLIDSVATFKHTCAVRYRSPDCLQNSLNSLRQGLDTFHRDFNPCWLNGIRHLLQVFWSHIDALNF